MGLKFLAKNYVFGTKGSMLIMFPGIVAPEFEFEKQDFRHVIVEKRGR